MKMKYTHAFIIFTTILVFVFISGCKYNVAEPLNDKPHGETTTTTITSVDPPEATPGVNIITINGTNFTGAIDTAYIQNEETNTDTGLVYNGVWFDNVQADVVEFSTTSIKVRRPNIVSDTVRVKVAPNNILIEGVFNPYRIYPVIQAYGNFNDNVALHVAAIDNAQNIYVIDQSNQNRIYTIAPDGSKSYDTTQSNLPRFPRDAVVGPDGRLYLVGNGANAGHANINVVDLSTKPYQWSVWRTISGKSVRFGDFDANGYFYAGGGRTDLMIIRPDSTFAASGMYATGATGDSILSVRAYAGYLYVAARLGTGEKGIYRHSIGAGGALGPREQYLDLVADARFTGRTIRGLAMSSNNTMYISTDSPNPLLIVDPVSKNIDYFYKSIIPSNGKFIFWGNGNYVYMMCGNASPAVDWKFYKVNMGITGAAK